jgi:hypothetical protein
VADGPAAPWSIVGSLRNGARRHPDALAVVALALLVTALLGRALLPGRVLSPADILLTQPPWSALAPGRPADNPLLTDVVFMFHPWTLHAGREIGSGRFPLWNPAAFAGAPFFANPQTALLFPLTALAYALPAPTALGLIAMLKMALAGVGTHVFLRLLGAHPAAALVGAVGYMLGGGLVVWLQWSLGTAMACLPWLFAAAERLRRHDRAGSVALLALASAAALLAGYPQAMTLALVIVGAWALTRARRAVAPVAFLARAAAGLALGVALAAVQLLPFLEYARESSVLHYRRQWMPTMAAPARTAVTMLMPYYYGSPEGRDYWGYWNFNEITATVGPVPLLVLAAALVAGRTVPGARFFLVLAAVSAPLVWDVPHLTAALARVPPLSLVITHRFSVFLAFALAVLGGLGTHALLTAPAAQRRALAVALRLGFVALAAAALGVLVADGGGPDVAIPLPVQFLTCLVLLAAATLLGLHALHRPDAGAGAAAGLVVVQIAALAPLAATYNTVVDRSLFYPAPPPAIAHVQRATAREPGRVLLPAGGNLGLLYGLSEVAGYDGMTPRRIEELASPRAGVGVLMASGPLDVTVDPASPAFDLLGIRWVVTPPGYPPPASRFALDYDGPDGRVYRNPAALPRAFVVGDATCVDDADAIGRIRSGRVDLARSVLIADCDAALPATGPGGAATAEIREASAAQLRIAVATEAPGWLVVTDTWLPGWRATVGGRAETVRRADHAFRAVFVPAGRHEVDLRYDPDSVRYGAGLSAGALIAVVALFAARARRRRHHATALLGLAATLLAGPDVAAAAALERAPASLTVTPAVTPGQTMLLRLTPVAKGTPRVAPGAPPGAEHAPPGAEHAPPGDVHVIRIPAGRPHFAFLSADGAWTTRFQPWQSATRLDAPLEARWRVGPPAGWFTLLVVFTRPGGDPRDRGAWTHAPLLGRVAVRASPRATGDLFPPWAVPAAATVAAAALVLAYPSIRRRPTDDAP